LATSAGEFQFNFAVVNAETGEIVLEQGGRCVAAASHVSLARAPSRLALRLCVLSA
jgi:hypothetical protein